MTERFSIASVAGLVGEPSRAAILLALLDGRALPAGELARHAKLSAAAASLHLKKMIEGGLLVVQSAGRHRYYRLASPEVAHALEALGAIATVAPPLRSLSSTRAQLRVARTCYDHLAGACAVALAQRLEQNGVLRVQDDRSYTITADGSSWLLDVMQVDTALLPRRRAIARRCLDWTERRSHVAGPLGAAFLERFTAWRWVARTPDSRALRITSRGWEGLKRLGVTVENERDFRDAKAALVVACERTSRSG
jgi:DNA-binding transcriptional ArsR family regulator/DNA-binding PadR family transcriptional regulator